MVIRGRKIIRIGKLDDRKLVLGVINFETVGGNRRQVSLFKILIIEEGVSSNSNPEGIQMVDKKKVIGNINNTDFIIVIVGL